MTHLESLMNLLKMKKYLTITIVLILCSISIEAQHSVAREWNEELLEAIRKDLARPTVHARNIHHVTGAMYDAWAVYDHSATTYLLGKTVDGYVCSFNGVPTPMDIELAREEAISYAAYRIMKHRFSSSPGAAITIPALDNQMNALGYNIMVNSTNYATGDPAHLGNYIAQCYINLGLQDGANESGGYSNTSYQPVNNSLIVDLPGNPNISNFNRWQPLTLDHFIDQGGNPIPINTPPFLSPEWGQVTNFSLKPTDLTTYTRNNFDYLVYHDPGGPPQLDAVNNSGLSDEYKWGFALVSKWSAHLDPADSVMWDISPASIGNIQSLPTNFTDYDLFYDDINGGDASIGHTLNPATGQPYTPQMVPRGDYTRVLAEFWADGPDSETPPGHWLTLLNYVNDHPDFEKRWKGVGPILNDLEWDVKAYFTMGGTVHDAAVVAWGVKGWYDYLRPISALRCMGDNGQCTDPNLPNYSIGGIPLDSGLIEQVQPGDPLAGTWNQHLNKIKVRSWKGPAYVNGTATNTAGVDWILLENWNPYQRPSFVTPPFAGYVSGHSTFSRAAAEVMTMMTGNAFFPGGMGEFTVVKDQFLVFEEGPSVSFTLQWATYRDASDQCSLSRIWGGIHPPADDIPGRLMGIEIGVDAFHFAENYFCNNIELDLFANLEGAYDTSTSNMATTLNTPRQLLPGQAQSTTSGQPYNTAPWNYNGSEDVTTYDSTVVDWVLVSILESPSPTDKVFEAAALLHSDGHIEFMDSCIVDLDPAMSYYVRLEHRNHLPILSPSPVPIVNRTLSLDFRSMNSYANFGSGQKEIASGVWAMFAGNSDQFQSESYDISGSDNYLWNSNNGFFNKYLPSDFNLNGDINADDKGVWLLNNGIFSSLPQN